MENEIYKTPQANLETEIKDEGVELASRGSRMIASIIDALTIVPISIAFMYFTGGFDDVFQGQQPSLQYLLVMNLISVGIFLIIHGKIMLRDGQTWGKKAQKIKMVSIDGGDVTLKILAKRYGIYWGLPQIPVVGQFINMVNILFIFSKSKRCLHDHVGGTKVIKLINKSSGTTTA